MSAARMEPYLAASQGEQHRALDLYSWNLQLSAALWELIAIVEVTVRNSMHDRLTAAYGERWFNNTSILDDRSLRTMRQAEVRARRGSASGRAPTAGRVVSEITFGGWVALLDKGGSSVAAGRKLRYHDTLWLPALAAAFPSGPGHQKKTNSGLRVVQSVRNRIAHHEKIFQEPFKDTRLDLVDLHEHCLDVARWVSVDVGIWASGATRVPDVLARRPLPG